MKKRKGGERGKTSCREKGNEGRKEGMIFDFLKR